MVAWVEFVCNKEWLPLENLAIMSGIEDVDSAFIFKEEQRTAIKAFVDRKDIFAVLPT